MILPWKGTVCWLMHVKTAKFSAQTRGKLVEYEGRLHSAQWIMNFCLEPQFSLLVTSLNELLQRLWKLVTPSDFTGID